MADKQIQKAGDGSTLVQAGVYSVGLSYADARDIALDVFKQNFIKLAGEAFEQARIRAELITDKYLSELRRRYPDGLSRAHDPGLQRALFRVQEEFACSGDERLGDLLVEMLVDRTIEQSRTLRQLALGEALVVAPKLTQKQISTLTLVFVVQNCKFVGPIEADYRTAEAMLRQLLQDEMAKLGDPATSSNDLLYLQYTGCLTIAPLTGQPTGQIYLNKYPFLFSEGVNPHSIREELLPAFVPHPRDSERYVLPISDPSKLTLHLQVCQLSEYEDEIRNLMSGDRMSPDDVRSFLEDGHPRTAQLLSALDDSALREASLTTVGVALGHADMQRVLGSRADLSIWIPDDSL